MTISSISTSAIQQILTSQLQAEEVNLSSLDEQLATGTEYTNLTDYAPSDALNLLNLQGSATQSQAYLGVISTVQARLSGYDTTMTDMESIVAQAQSLADADPSYNATTAAGLGVTATNLLQSVTQDLNQTIGGRYIYSGSRYETAPVSDLTTLSSANLTPAVYTDSASLPSYDTDYTAGSTTLTTSAQAVTIGGTIAAGQSASITINGKTYSYDEQSTDTSATVASALQNLVAADIPGTTVSGSTITVGSSGTIQGTSSNNTNTSAYTTETATISSGYTVPYGVTSTNPAFQQLIAGLRYLQAAGNSTNSTTYASDVQQAATLLTSALSGIQTLHTAVASNQNTLTGETTAQNNTISQLTTQVDNIQQVDVTQVSTELTELQTQLQASYSATGMIEKLSIVSYLS